MNQEIKKIVSGSERLRWFQLLSFIIWIFNKLHKLSEPPLSVLYHRDNIIHITDHCEDRFTCVNWLSGSQTGRTILLSFPLKKLLHFAFEVYLWLFHSFMGFFFLSIHSFMVFSSLWFHELSYCCYFVKMLKCELF